MSYSHELLGWSNLLWDIYYVFKYQFLETSTVLYRFRALLGIIVLVRWFWRAQLSSFKVIYRIALRLYRPHASLMLTFRNKSLLFLVERYFTEGLTSRKTGLAMHQASLDNGTYDVKSWMSRWRPCIKILIAHQEISSTVRRNTILRQLNEVVYKTRLSTSRYPTT